MLTIDCSSRTYREINSVIRRAVKDGERELRLLNANGQRYIGTGINCRASILIEGIPGNDLGAFMDGPEIFVDGNAQDCVANTMNSGKIVVRGHAGDVLGYGMRGGKLYVLGDCGYRVGIHMKSYGAQVPVVVIGGSVRDFCGEYMAGGILVILGLAGNGGPPVGRYCATGMHEGTIYVRGSIEPGQLGREAEMTQLEDSDFGVLRPIIEEFCNDMGTGVPPADQIMAGPWCKLRPVSYRPYGNIYAY